MSSKDNEKPKSKSECNASYTDLPDMKTNSSTTKTSVYPPNNKTDH